MRSLNRILLPILLAFAVIGCRGLAPEGPYKGDKALYSADLTITTSYDLIHEFVKWEFKNRAGLTGTPNVTLYADTLRRQAPAWFSTALTMRDTYAAVPTEGNLVALNQAVAVLRAAMLEVTKYKNTYRVLNTIEAE